MKDEPVMCYINTKNKKILKKTQPNKQNTHKTPPKQNKNNLHKITHQKNPTMKKKVIT